MACFSGNVVIDLVFCVALEFVYDPGSMDITVLSFILAWFIQMGVHEGAHAYAAHACGDDTAYLLGKKTVDPFRHIEWSNLSSVLLGVVLPVYTAAKGLIPMGMAWVPVNPLRFRKMRRDHALVAACGPLSNLALCAALLPLGAILSHAAPDGPVTNALFSLVRATYLTSLVYGLFNAIPLPPLDGSRVLYYVLPARGRQIMDDIEPYGFWILILLFGFGRGGELIEPALVAGLALWGLVT